MVHRWSLIGPISDRWYDGPALAHSAAHRCPVGLNARPPALPVNGNYAPIEWQYKASVTVPDCPGPER